MNKTPTRSRSYQMGAAHERQAILAFLRRSNRKDHPVVEWIIHWIEERTKRFNKRPGGLQGKRKGAK